MTAARADDDGDAQVGGSDRGCSRAPRGAGGGWWRSGAVLFTGLAATTLLVVWSGAGEVARALAISGWALIPLSAAHAVSLGLDAVAWWVLTPPGRPRLRVFLLARWIRESVNALLPVAQIGGEAVAARVLAARGGRAGWHGAVVALDLAAEFVAMVGLGGAAAGVLVGLVGPERRDEAVVVGLAMLPPGAIALALLAGQGFGLPGRLARRLAVRWPALAAGLRDAQAAASAVWSRPLSVLASIGLHGLAWLYGAVETWAALAVLGHPVSPACAFALEGTTEVLRAFGFAVPGMLAIQEGSLVVVGGLLGIPPSEAVALSLFRRARDVALGLPALMAWWVAGRRAASGAGPDAPVDRLATTRPAREEAWTS